MKNLKLIFSLSALAGTALLLATAPGNSATSASQCLRMNMTAAECACQDALDSGSSSAIRQFRRLYPRSDTACNATASTGAAWYPHEQEFLTKD
jgi:hypothetical protein